MKRLEDRAIPTLKGEVARRFIEQAEENEQQFFKRRLKIKQRSPEEIEVNRSSAYDYTFK